MVAEETTGILALRMDASSGFRLPGVPGDRNSMARHFKIPGKPPCPYREVLPALARKERLKLLKQQLRNLMIAVEPGELRTRVDRQDTPPEGAILPALIMPQAAKHEPASLNYIKVYGTTRRRRGSSTITTYFFQTSFPYLLREFLKNEGRLFLAITDIYPSWKRGIVERLGRPSRSRETLTRVLQSDLNLMGHPTVLYRCSPQEASELLPILALPMIYTCAFVSDSPDIDRNMATARNDRELLQELLINPRVVTVEIWQDWNGANLFTSGQSLAMLRKQVSRAEAASKRFIEESRNGAT